MNAQSLNLASTVRSVRASLGLPSSGPIPREMLDDYFRALSAAIIARPDLYSEQAVANAYRYRSQGEFDPLEQTSIVELGKEFGGALLDEGVKIGDGAAEIGRGVVNTAKLARYGIPLTVALVVGAWLWKNVIRPARA